MSEKEGVLIIQPRGRWTIVRSGHQPIEITSGELFRVEVNGELKPTRMEFRHFTGTMKARTLRGQSGENYSVDGYALRNGIRAVIGAED